nr:MAG TPA: hypothetical protein [Caudoviricetes sp.]DAZ50828.1 MAG TPA: hypothetical protein [Caudoviricetes sp.]
MGLTVSNISSIICLSLSEVRNDWRKSIWGKTK